MVNNDLTAAAPAHPVAAYLGGKRKLASRIIQQLRLIPHTTYVEPFVGMGGVFLRRPFRARAEVINDVSRDVITLFRVLQRHYVPLMDMLRWQITSRAEFVRLHTAVPDTLTDLERAVRFLYLQRLAFGGKIEGRNFGVSPADTARFDTRKLAPMLEAAHERLAGVVIECLPWDELLRRYDRPETLFYLDPPYWGNETDYGDGVFSRADFGRLNGALEALKGRFILSLNDVPGVRQTFRGFRIEAVETHYSISGGRGKRVGEVIISRPD
ncbi:MAG: DNA adenine methylase [Acidiphilium sp.]